MHDALVLRDVPEDASCGEGCPSLNIDTTVGLFRSGECWGLEHGQRMRDRRGGWPEGVVHLANVGWVAIETC